MAPWGAAQATAAGISIALGGTIRDAVQGLGSSGSLGPGPSEPYIGYTMVYHIEIGLLFATLIAIGPLVRSGPVPKPDPLWAKLGLAEFAS